MKIELIEINSFKRELSVIVPWDELKENYEQEFQYHLNNYTPDKGGGRKGKLTKMQINLFKKQKTDEIELIFRDKAMNNYFQKAIEEKKIYPLPNTAENTKLKFETNSDLEFIVVFEVVPSFKLPNYTKKYKIKTNKYVASDKDVTMSLNDLQNNYSTPEEVKGAAEEGFDLVVDYQELNQEGNLIPGQKINTTKLKLGDGYGYNLKDFIGCKVGDEIKTMIEIEGKKVNFQFLIKQIYKNILPELNDDFAKKLDPEIKNMDDLKSKIQNNIQKSLDEQHKKEIDNAIIEYFVSKTKFDPPTSMVNNYIEYIIQDMKQKNDNNIDERQIRKEYEEIANKNVKWYLIKTELIKTNKITVTKKDIDKKIKEIIKNNKTQEAEIKEFYSKEENLNQLDEQLLNDKIFDLINEFAINKISEKSTSDLRKEK